MDEVLRSGEPIDKVYLDFRELDYADAETAMAEVERVLGPRTNIYRSAQGVLDILSRDATKAAMAQQLARRMQVPAEQTMAIGDGDGDAALLQWAGIGVAMGNATPAAKAAADVITSSNQRDGVADALDQYLLGRGSPGARISVPKPGLVTG